MTPQEWERVKNTFDAVLAVPPADRAAFFHSNCRENSAIRNEVERLLAEHEQASGFLDHPPGGDRFALSGSQSSGSEAPLIGQKISHYQFVAKLGEGGMGVVYRAFDTQLLRPVALKVLSHTALAHPENNRRFLREARAASALNHSNIAHIYEVGEAGSVRFIVMEYIEGQTLAATIREAPLDFARVLDFCLQSADAFAEAHEHGIIHRDVKPSNIMINPRGQLKVLDFGLAKVDSKPRDEASQASLTSPGVVMGTTRYMSPEQVLGHNMDQRTDIFSLGIVFYEMVTGRQAFAGETATETMDQILHSEPEPIVSLRANVPPELERIIRKCLEKDREKRYPSARELHMELLQLKEFVAFRGLGQAGVPTGVGPKRLFTIASAVALLVILVWLGVWSLRRAGTGVPGSAANPNAFTVTQITSDPGQKEHLNISPDGKWVVYVKGHLLYSKGDIYLQAVGGHTPINLTKDSASDNSEPAFSPDGERIVFRSERQGGGLFLMGRTGESATRLTGTGYSPAWSPDGTEIVYAESSVYNPYSRAGLSRLWVVKIANGGKRPLTETDGVQPSWSPHGWRIAYWAIGEANKIRDILTISAMGGQPVAVTNDAAVDFNPIWAPDGKHLYFLSDRGGTMSLWKLAIDESSGKPLSAAEPITTPSPFISNLSISADGKRLAFISELSMYNIQRIGFNAVTGQAAGVPVAVTDGTRDWANVDPSPDGQQIVMRSGPPQYDIYISRADGTELRQITNDMAFDVRPRWSPDGSTIAFSSNRGGTGQIWSVKPDGSELRRLTDYPASGLMLGGAWSPDGSRIAALVEPPNNKIVIFDTRKAWQDQTHQELDVPQGVWSGVVSWSPDGSKLVVTGGSGTFVYSFESKSYNRLTDYSNYPNFAMWLGDSQRLLISRDGRLLLVDSLLKTTREVLALPPDYLEQPRLSRDNRQIFFVRGKLQCDIYMLRFK